MDEDYDTTAPLPPSDDHTPPSDIPNYEQWRFIGAGGFGRVWLVQESVTQVPRVVKVLAKKDDQRAAREVAGVRNFQQSAKSHPGLLQILAVGETPTCYYCVMPPADNAGGEDEYVPLTLRRWMQSRGRCAPRAALALIREIADGVAHLHAHDLAHYDLKPENILIVEGRPRIADVSLVRPRDDGPPQAGTLAYMPPGGRADDLYALGKILYELITARPARQFPSLPADLLDARAPLLRDAIAICNRACQLDPHKSFPSADAWRDAVDAVLHPPRSPMARWRRMSPRGRWATVTGVSVVLVAGIWVGDSIRASFVPRLQKAEPIMLGQMDRVPGPMSPSDPSAHPVLYDQGAPLPFDKTLVHELAAPSPNFCLDFRATFRRPWSTVVLGLVDDREQDCGYHVIFRGQPDGDGLYIAATASNLPRAYQGERSPIRGHPQAGLDYRIRLAHCRDGVTLAVWPLNLAATDPIVRRLPPPPEDLRVKCVTLHQYTLDAHAQGEISSIGLSTYSAPLVRVEDYPPGDLPPHALPAWTPAADAQPVPWGNLLASPYHPYDSAAWNTIGWWCWWSSEAPFESPKEIRCVPFSTQNRIVLRDHTQYVGRQFLRFDGGVYQDFEAEAVIRLADPLDPRTRAHDPFVSASHHGHVGIALRMQDTPSEEFVWGGGYCVSVALHPDPSVRTFAVINRLPGLRPASPDLNEHGEVGAESLATVSRPGPRAAFFDPDGFRLKVRAIGPRIELFLNDARILSAEDTPQRTFSSGRLALYCQCLIPIVDSFTVRPLPAP